MLDKHVSELIAAGEVVERPASVIKELIENSIDAKAENITVEIKNGGTVFMRVSDDGSGILRDDIRTAFLRHATSKVKVEDDLEHISTLGFRGEALASISAVSRLQLITRSGDEEIGSCYEIDGGEEVSLQDAGCPKGSTFVIRDLFYNIPARAKFLKKDISEGNAVSSVVDKIALSHPEISFTYIRDGKKLLHTFGDGKLISAIYSVYGKEFAQGLIPVEYKLDGVSVSGYVTKPVNSRATRNMQNFFINGRYVKSRTAMAALEEACKGSVMVGKYPACVLKLDVPYEIIDVNVHPAKIEVRFINERPVFDAVYHSVKSALLKSDERKKLMFKNDSAYNDIPKTNPFTNAAAVFKERKREETAKQPVKPVKDEYDPFEELDFLSDKQPSKASTYTDSLILSDSSNPFDLLYKNAVKKEESVERKKQEIAEKREREALAELESADIPDKEITILPKEKSDLRFIGEVFDTYIIVEKASKELLLIDKHAAHERIIYERLKKNKSSGNSQLLLQPVSVTLGKNEYDAAVNNIEMFSECAFEIEDFGNGTVLVRSAPQYLDAAEIPDCISEMSEFIAKGKRDIYTEKMDWFYQNVSCRSAIKAGSKSSERELMDIVKTLEENLDLKYCPHGRPICVVMTKYEIEKQFGRV